MIIVVIAMISAPYLPIWAQPIGVANIQIPTDTGRELFTPTKGWVLMRTAGAVDGATLDAAGYSLTADDIS